jgi:hypothetical protein
VAESSEPKACENLVGAGLRCCCFPGAVEHGLLDPALLCEVITLLYIQELGVFTAHVVFPSYLLQVCLHEQLLVYPQRM